MAQLKVAGGGGADDACCVKGDVCCVKGDVCCVKDYAWVPGSCLDLHDFEDYKVGGWGLGVGGWGLEVGVWGLGFGVLEFGVWGCSIAVCVFCVTRTPQVDVSDPFSHGSKHYIDDDGGEVCESERQQRRLTVWEG